MIVGTLIGTAIIASSLALGTTVRASLSHVAVSELGPVDELVISRPEAGGAVRDAVSAARLDLAGTLPLVEVPATVVTKAFVVRVAPVQVLATDFAHAASFGPATGITGPTPAAGEVVVSEALARQVSLSPGDRMAVYAGTTVFTVRVVRILPTIGVVGLPRLGGDGATTALDAFVAPGTIESLPSAAAALAVIQRTKGPSPASAAVAGALRRAVAGIPATVVPIKAQVLAAAAEGARHFDRFLAIFAGLGVISGLLLVALAVTILVDERRPELVILDALGVRRRDIAASMLVETAVYGATGAALGCAAGVAVSRLLVPLARGTFGGGVGLSVDLIWSVPATVAIDAFAIGVVVSLLAVTTAVALTRRWPASRRSPRAPWTVPLLRGAAGATAGAAVLSAGFVRHPAPALVVGDGTVLAGLIVLALVAVQVPVAQQLRSVAHRRSVAIWLGLATAVAIRARTILVVASTTFAVFGIALAASVAGGYRSDQAHLSRALGGTSAVEVSSDAARPVPPADVAGLPGVRAVIVTSSVPATAVITTGAIAAAAPSAAGHSVDLIGFGADFVGHGSPPLQQRSRALASDHEAFLAVARDPAMVIVGADFGTGLETATRLRPPQVGQQLVVADPDTGRSRSLIIAGVAQSARWAGIDHVYAATVVDADLTGTASGNLLFVSIDGATNPDVVAAVVNGTHLVNGARAESFRSLAAARVAAEQALLRLAEAAVSLGLAAGAFAVLNTLSRAVAARAREIGVLRTMAMSRGAIHRTFAVEAVWLALLGAVGGAGCGILMGWLLGHSGAFAAGAAPVLAGPTLVAVMVVAIAASLLASWGPARRASRVDPAVAMRTNDG